MLIRWLSRQIPSDLQPDTHPFTSINCWRRRLNNVQHHHAVETYVHCSNRYVSTMLVTLCSPRSVSCVHVCQCNPTMTGLESATIECSAGLSVLMLSICFSFVLNRLIISFEQTLPCYFADSAFALKSCLLETPMANPSA